MIKHKKTIIIFMIIVMLFQQPVEVFAGKKAYTSYLIGQGEYVSDVIVSKSTLWGGTYPEFEIKSDGFGELVVYYNNFDMRALDLPYLPTNKSLSELEYTEDGNYLSKGLNEFEEIIDDITLTNITGLDIAEFKVNNKGMLLYPAIDDTLFDNNMSQYDMDRAANSSVALTTSLNSMLHFINNGKKYSSNEELILASQIIRPNSEDLGFETKTDYNVADGKFIGVKNIQRGNYVFEVYYATDIIPQSANLGDSLDYKNDDEFFRNAPTGTATGELYAYIFKYRKGETLKYSIENAYQAIYAVPKGYKPYKIPLFQNGIITGAKLYDPLNQYPEIKNVQPRPVEKTETGPTTMTLYDEKTGLPTGTIDTQYLKTYTEIPEINEGKFDGDVKYVSIHHISMVANYSYTMKGYSAGGINPVSDRMNFLEKLIVGMISGLLWGLRSILGLYSFQELLFNEGARSSIGFEGGLMNAQWWNSVMEFFMITLAIAGMLLLVAVGKILIQTNWATVNPNLKLSLTEQITKIFITLASMVGAVPLVRFLLEFNNLFVSIFSSQGYVLDTWTRAGTYANVLAGILIECVYFYILIYLNVLYLLRGIILAILIASSPIFIVSMAFSTKGKGLFDNWLKEVISNIFIQSFHAFMLTFLMTVSGGSRAIEQMVIIGSLIPLTKVFKNLIIPSALGVESMSETISKQGIQMAKSVGKMAVAVASGGLAAGAMVGAGAGAMAGSGALTGGATGATATAGTTATTNSLGNLIKTKGQQMFSNQGSMPSGSGNNGSGSIIDTIGAVADFSEGFAYGDVSQTGFASKRFNKNMDNFKNSNMAKVHQMAQPPNNPNILGYKDDNDNKPIRDKSQYINRGVENITPTRSENGRFQMATFDLNWDNLNNQDRGNFQYILDKSNELQGNPKAFNEFKKERGIRDIIVSPERDKITKIAYSAEAMKNLGYRDITPNNNWLHEGEKREVYKETRYSGNNQDINLTWDFANTLPKKENIKKGA